MNGSKIINQLDIIRIKNNKQFFIKDNIVNEDILEIYINGDKYFEMVFSMTKPEALAAGFLFTQGIIRSKSDIMDMIFHEEKKQCHIIINDNARARLNRFKKEHQVKGSSGGTLLQDKAMVLSSRPDGMLYITYRQVLSLIKMHQEYSMVFHQTGAVHSAGLCDTSTILFHYEDIGRHNALDKLAGDTLLNKIDTHDKIATLSCRMSLEIIGKIIRTGIPIVISNAAPTLSAVKLANEAGLTMIGFAR
ncbi:MAG: formate dehydrogenase accessory sulfurtransferase FdhD, partial [Desulfobacula sp.]|nr:formate dehydrogenase accessory sulfurtransferase FdhD [Desulfobacula sp.]